MSWWSDLQPWLKATVVGTAGAGVGALGAYLLERRAIRLGQIGFTPYQDLPDLIDYDSEEPAEPEPPGIEYADHDVPCVPPPHPWDTPVAAMLEGGPEDEGCALPKDLEPQKKTEVTFTAGAERPVWPVDTDENRKIRVSYQDVRGKWHGRWGREFGATRKSKKVGERVHVGVDLFADPGDIVVSMEDGEVLGGLPFYKGTGALYVLTDSGHIINYGELERRSWRDYGVTGALMGGQRVTKGQRIGRVGLSSDGSHMLHVETYTPDVTLDQIRRSEMQWIKDDPPPGGILDPTEYLLRAQQLKHESMVADV